MTNYHVTNSKGSKKWNVKKAGGKRSSATADTQKEAEKIAKELLKKAGGGEVRIHKPNGGPIRDSDTVAPGNDPRSIKDTKH